MPLVSRTTLHERGQVTIPFRVRSLLNLEPGAGLLLFANEREIVIRPVVERPLEMAGLLGKDDGMDRVKDMVNSYKGF
jgi:AbrB family looped-hinge helix DNA binding protein